MNGSTGPCSVYLMFSDCNHNNNKFYVAQCLKDKMGNHQLWTRYGRVGETGTPGSIPLAADKAIKEYEKKVKQKTGKGYKPIEVSLGGDKQDAEEEKGDVKYAPSKLKPEVKKLMDFIFDFAMIKKSAQHVGFDTDRMPLGQLSADQVNKGIKCLKAIEELIDSGKGSHAQFSKLSGEFYTMIPHNFGRQSMSNFVIKDKNTVLDKMGMCNTMMGIVNAFDIEKKSKKKKEKTLPNPSDGHYENLRCKIEPLDTNGDEFKMVKHYFENGFSSYSKQKIVQAYRIDREGEKARFNNKLGNKQLLWHGSGFTNFSGILS